jgi:hypothetical protein
MDRKLSLDAFASDDATNRKRFFDSSSSPGDDRPGKDLNAFLFAFQNLCVDINRITDCEFGRLFLQAGFGD